MGNFIECSKDKKVQSRKIKKKLNAENDKTFLPTASFDIIFWNFIMF